MLQVNENISSITLTYVNPNRIGCKFHVIMNNGLCLEYRYSIYDTDHMKFCNSFDGDNDIIFKTLSNMHTESGKRLFQQLFLDEFNIEYKEGVWNYVYNISIYDELSLIENILEY
jgi:hypothetical protein